MKQSPFSPPDSLKKSTPHAYSPFHANNSLSKQTQNIPPRVDHIQSASTSPQIHGLLEEQDQIKSNLHRMDYTERVIDLLSSLLYHENQALKEENFDALEQSIKNKEALTVLYSRQMHSLRKENAFLMTLSLEEKERLKNKSLILSQLLSENEIVLRAAIQSRHTLLQTITSAIKEVREDQTTLYSSNAEKTSAEKDPRFMSFTLNKEY